MSDLQTYINNQIKAARAETFAKSDQITLGALIAKLQAVKDKKSPVVFDFCGMKPTNVYSWRGAYCELALGYTDPDSKDVTVASLLKELKSAIGKSFTGYKGGDFTMSKDTPIWVDNWGRYTLTAIVDVLDDGYQVMLITKQTSY
jgi:hypothetical protein